MSQVKIAEVEAKAGDKTFGYLAIARLANGADLKLPVHILAGQKPGPTLTLIATQHGNEIGPIGSFKRLVAEIDPKQLAGNVILIPVANPIAFDMRHRSTWVDALYSGSTGNMSRLWPGNPKGFLTERMCAAIVEEVISKSDYNIDFHGSTTASISIYYSYLMRGEDELSRKARDMTIAFGMELIMRRPPRHPGSPGRTLSDYIYEDLKIPCLCCEIGHFWGLGPEREERPHEELRRDMVEVGFTGATNVMKLLHMIPGEPILPKKQLIISPETRCQPSAGGILVPEVTRQDIGRIFPRGFVLGRVFSPYDFKELDVITTPYEQNVLCSANDQLPFSRVNPGDQAFHVADYSTAEWVTH